MAERRTPIWRKEIHLLRRREAGPATPASPVTTSPASKAAVTTGSSIWKREIHLRPRRSGTVAAAEAGGVAALPVAPDGPRAVSTAPTAASIAPPGAPSADHSPAIVPARPSSDASSPSPGGPRWADIAPLRPTPSPLPSPVFATKTPPWQPAKRELWSEPPAPTDPGPREPAEARDQAEPRRLEEHHGPSPRQASATTAHRLWEAPGGPGSSEPTGVGEQFGRSEADDRGEYSPEGARDALVGPSSTAESPALSAPIDRPWTSAAREELDAGVPVSREAAGSNERDDSGEHPAAPPALEEHAPWAGPVTREATYSPPAPLVPALGMGGATWPVVDEETTTRPRDDQLTDIVAPAELGASAPTPAEVSGTKTAEALELPELAQPTEHERPSIAKRSRRQHGASAEIVGLRVGSSQLSAAVVRNGGGRPELLRIAQKGLERGIVVAGEVREPDALAAALKSFFAEQKLPRQRVRIGIASNRIGVRALEVPAIDDPKLLANAIRFRAQELLSIPISDAVLDHVVLGDVASEQGRMRRVLLAFAHRELIDRYVEACKKARLKLMGIDLEAFALLRAVSDPLLADTPVDRATVAISIGHERTIFAVSEGDVCDFARVLEWGGSSFNVALARMLNLTPSQTEPIKLSLPLAGDVSASGLSAVQVEAARVAMRGELQVLARDLLASLQFYQSRPGSLAIGEILLTGGGAQLGGMDTELAATLGVPVRLADPFSHVEVARKVQLPRQPGALSIAIGLGIEV